MPGTGTAHLPKSLLCLPKVRIVGRGLGPGGGGSDGDIMDIVHNYSVRDQYLETPQVYYTVML